MTGQKHDLSNILENSSILREYLKKINKVTELNKAVLAALPSELAAHCQVANLRNNTLILTTSSPVWKHQITFQQADLLSRLRKNPEWAGISHINCQVAFPGRDDIHVPSSLKAGLPPPSLSAKSAEQIKLVASVIDAPKLKKSLEKLAKHAKVPNR